MSLLEKYAAEIVNTVDIDSGLGRGTTFTVTLPMAAREPETGSAVKTSGSHPAVAGASILLVEDNASLLALCRRVLEKQGHSVVPCDNADSAIAAARDGKFDLVITDMVMPNINGARLVQSLESAGLNAPVLYMSGYTQDDVLELASRRDRTAFLPKPFTPGELAGAVRELVAARVA